MQAQSRPIVTLLLAAGCEGKTTALLQAAYAVVEHKPGWQILRRTDDAELLNPAEIIPLLNKHYRWLILLDEADRVADSLHSFISHIPKDLRGRVHFLVACRDSDWLASGANSKDWASASQFHQERLVGLDKNDAAAIVAAWATYGKAGLGDLASVPESKRSQVLESRANEEAKTTHGAFFGALLAVRHGSDLPGHARLMLERLGQRPISSGGTLRDALAYIAAMHAEGLEFLSRPVLAQALGCPMSKLHREVIAPLGQEAAATTTSSFIYTRHRRVAQAVVGVLEKDFGEDVSELFVQLGQAAIEAYKLGYFLPENLLEWRNRIARHFFESGRRDVALRVASAVLSREPNDGMTIVGVAHLYRDADVPDKAVELFRHVPPSAKMHRGFYYEWATAEGACGNHILSVILGSFSISDDCADVRVDNNQAKLSLAGVGLAFSKLFDAYRDIVFRDGRIAAAVLGQQLHLDPRAAEYFRTGINEGVAAGGQTPTVDDAFKIFRNAVAAAEALGVADAVSSVVPDAAHLDYAGLQQLVYASLEAKQRRH